MLLRIDCPETGCGSKYAWQTKEVETRLGGLHVQINLYCVACPHCSAGSGDRPLLAAAGAIETYRIQTTAKEESA